MSHLNAFSSAEHAKVLLHETVDGLALKENGIYIDGLKIADTVTIEILYELETNRRYTINYAFRIAKENI